MNSESIPFIDEDGELRCAKCSQGQVVPGTLFCAGCGPATACELCGVSRCAPGHKRCNLCISIFCAPPPAGCSADCAKCESERRVGVAA